MPQSRRRARVRVLERKRHTGVALWQKFPRALHISTQASNTVAATKSSFAGQAPAASARGCDGKLRIYNEVRVKLSGNLPGELSVFLRMFRQIMFNRDNLQREMSPCRIA